MSDTGSRHGLRPGMIDRLFRFKVMRISARDVPVVEVGDEVGDLSRIVQALADASVALAQRPAQHQVPAQSAIPIGPGASGGLSKAEAVELAVQTWRLARRVEALDPDKFPRERKQFADSLRRFQKILETHAIECVDPTGQMYVDGWDEVEVVSVESAESGTADSRRRIKQTVMPIIRVRHEVVVRGQVVVVQA